MKCKTKEMTRDTKIKSRTEEGKEREGERGEMQRNNTGIGMTRKKYINERR